MKPRHTAAQGVADQLCAAGAAGNETISAALRAGGDAARNVLAAIVWGTCSDPSAIASAVQEYFTNSTDRTDSAVLVP